MNLEKLLKPKTIAVVGASEKDGFGGDTCRNILTYTKDLNKVYFVNPKRDTVFGKPCYHSLEEIPVDVDLIIICTPQKAVYGLIEQAAKKNCGGAVVFASGYKEVGKEGVQLQKELVDLCEKNNIALMGPNCAGFANYSSDVFSFAFLMEERDRKGNIGMISQSGQICLAGLDKPDLKFSYVISSGNSASVKVEEYLDFLVDDEGTKVVAAYIEGIADPTIFVNALKKAAAKRKPVIVLKTGRSAKAATLAASHTGSIAGSDGAIDAVMKKYGVIRVDDIAELLGTAHMFSMLTTLPGVNKWASVNVSGGESGIIADMGQIGGIEYSDVSEKTYDFIRSIMPSYCTPNNPLDMTATIAYDSEKFAQTARALLKDDSVGGIIIGYTITDVIADATVLCLVRGLEILHEEPVNKPIVWLSFVEHTRNKENAEKIYALNVPILPTGMCGLKVLKNLCNFASFKYKEITPDISVPAQIKHSGRVAFSEYDSMKQFAAAGVDVGKAAVAHDTTELIDIGQKMGYPLALKVNSKDILHKSDVGGVKLNIKNSDEAVKAYEEIMTSCKKHCPDANIDGILVKPMLPKGTEIIVGMTNDSQFGPIMMVGLGGVFVELFKDVALYPAPFGKEEALKMIKSLNGYKLLNGYRGAAVCDVDALAELMVGLSNFASESKDSVIEFDINPVFVYEKGKGVAMADALVIRHEE